MNKKIVAWLLPLVISLLLFVIVRPAFAQIIEEQTNLAQYLIANDVEVGSEVVNGYHQVYYVFEGEKAFITEGSLNSTLPDTEGEFIVYRKSMNGVDQIFLYNLVSQSTIQITNSGNNTNPKINAGKVVWEGWTNDGWQVFFFDGTKVTQLTSGDLSMNPDVEGDYISYGRRDVSGTWRSVVYSISKKEAKEIAIGTSSRKPKVRDGKIILAGTGVEEEFPLTIEDLFLLDLAPLTTPDETPSPEPTPLLQPETVTEEEIIEELEATPSAEIIDTATPSGEIQ